ncbi:histamine H2 receptor-like [Orbicella faveolata]|uniref:histamine H2 receptor-like n=1 Tax=Orbicella faveolata TaxID=48498 RepID=UPI0009E37FF6|nr:histamine H2 receptor-like [Orbicella faveolata]
MLSISDCIPWMTVGLAESVAIVTLNLCTIIVFIRNRNLRKRSTYLVINLAVVDMFVGGFVVYTMFYWSGVHCNLFTWRSIGKWTLNILQVFSVFFPLSSLTNMTIIALERVHATYRPFKHRLLKKWLYGVIIAVGWITAGLVIVTYVLLALFSKLNHHVYLRTTFYLICLLIIFISYTSIAIKVRCGAQPQHHDATSIERKLTMTLFIVTFVSLLLCLPLLIFHYVLFITKFKILSFSVGFHLECALLVLFFANSLVNPILYTIRMPEYRSALLALFRKQPQQQRQVAVPLRDM